MRRGGLPFHLRPRRPAFWLGVTAAMPSPLRHPYNPSDPCRLTCQVAVAGTERLQMGRAGDKHHRPPAPARFLKAIALMSVDRQRLEPQPSDRKHSWRVHFPTYCSLYTHKNGGPGFTTKFAIIFPHQTINACEHARGHVEGPGCTNTSGWLRLGCNVGAES